jgi:hypothetical protein
MKLYRSRKYPKVWIAYSPATGWVKFPMDAEGWEKREPARGLDPIDIREVPISLAFATGIPGDLDFSEAA